MLPLKVTYIIREKKINFRYNCACICMFTYVHHALLLLCKNALNIQMKISYLSLNRC